MAFEQTIRLSNCLYDYTISPSVKKFTLKDNTFFETKVGNYELTRLLEKVPNSGEGFKLKIVINKELTGAKINITDKSGLRLVDIFKSEDEKVLINKRIYVTKKQNYVYYERTDVNWNYWSSERNYNSTFNPENDSKHNIIFEVWCHPVKTALLQYVIEVLICLYLR